MSGGGVTAWAVGTASAAVASAAASVRMSMVGLLWGGGVNKGPTLAAPAFRPLAVRCQCYGHDRRAPVVAVCLRLVERREPVAVVRRQRAAGGLVRRVHHRADVVRVPEAGHVAVLVQDHRLQVER